MSKYIFRGLSVLVLACCGCIGSQSNMSRGMQSRTAIDGDGEPITMDTTLDYIDMSATTVKDLKEFIVPGYEDKVTAPQVENIITNSIKLSTVTETIGNWTWVDGENKEANDDIKTFGLWYKDGKWHAYVTDILTPKVGQKSIFQTASVEGSESDTSVTMNFSELGWNFTFNRNGDKVLTAYEVEVYTAELDEDTGATKTEKTKLEVEGLKMYKSEPFMAVGHVTNCHYLVVNESDKGNITRFGNAQAAPDAEEILIKSERDSETGKLIGYFVRIKKKDVLGLVYKPDLEGFVTESDLLSFYYPDGSVTSMDQITTNGIEYAVYSDGMAYVASGEGLSGNVVLPWKVNIDGKEYKVTEIRRMYHPDNSFSEFIAPITVKKINNGAFSNCDSLISISIPSVTDIGSDAFSDCDSLESVNLPSVTEITDRAFSNCGSLKSISIPSATYIGSGAFSDCGSLSLVRIPSAIEIGSSAFYNCGSLSMIDFGSSPRSSIPTLVIDGGFNLPTTCKFIVPLGMYDEWIAAPLWSDLYSSGYKFEGYASAEQVKDKRNKSDNIAVTDSIQLSEWEFQCSDSTVLDTLKRSGKLTFDGVAWYLSADYINDYGLEEGIIEAAHDATSLVFPRAYISENGYVQVTATRSVSMATKAGEPYVTTTFVTNSIAPYAAMKLKLEQIAALEPPSSTVRDLITWANAVQSILKGDLIGGDSGLSPAAVLSASNKYYWDKQTETCYRMTVENDYTIMRAVTNVPPTVEVVLALEKELNKETSK